MSGGSWFWGSEVLGGLVGGKGGGGLGFVRVFSLNYSETMFCFCYLLCRSSEGSYERRHSMGKCIYFECPPIYPQSSSLSHHKSFPIHVMSSPNPDHAFTPFITIPFFAVALNRCDFVSAEPFVCI